MKKNLLLLFTLSLSCVQASVGADGVGGVKDSKDTRSVVSQPVGGTEFGPTAFASNNNFFMGATTVDAVDFPSNSLSRVQLNRVKGQWTVDVKPIAPATATVNGVATQNNPVYLNSIDNLTLFDSTNPVVTLAMVAGHNNSKNKICLVTDPLYGNALFTNATDVLDDASGDEICAAADASVAALAASTDTIFAAVPPDDEPWGVQNSGIIRLMQENNQLRVQQLDGSGPGADNAYKIDLTTHDAAGAYGLDYEFVKFAATLNSQLAAAVLGPQVDLWWDDTLQRLFVGLTGATGGSANPGSIQSLLVGYIDNNRLFLQPVVDLQGSYNPGYLGDASDAAHNTIIGFKADDASSLVTSAFKVRTMHTSTGKTYVIVNGGTNSIARQGLLKITVFALPLVMSGNQQQVGLIEAKNSQNIPVEKFADMTTVNDQEAIVGRNSLYLYHNGDIPNDFAITDMRVVGDTVYVSVSGLRDATNKQEQGIFYSQAIFDSSVAEVNRPRIRAWTPWQRVMGNTEKVSGFGLDENSGCYWYLEGANNKVAKVTRWDQGDASQTGIHVGSPLSKVIDPAFAGINGGGVYGIFSFDDETLGFKQYVATAFPYFSMMVATGYNRIAMIQTGAQDGNGVYQQTSAFNASGTNQNVFVFDNTIDPLKFPDLGAVTAAEVARVAPSDANSAKGWLFIGGERGIAVLRYKANNVFDGSGWGNAAGFGLSQLKNAAVDDYPGGSYYGFQQILYKSNGTTTLDITDVRKLVSDGTYLYILTRNKLHRLEMKQATMINGVLASDDDFKTPLDLKSQNYVVEKSSSIVEAFTLYQDQDEFFDLMLFEKLNGITYLALATTKGLIRIAINDGLGSIVNNGIHTILVQSTAADPASPSLGPVFRLDFVSQSRGGILSNDLAQGNLYALSVDRQLQHLNVYRFDVNNGFIAYFNEPYSNVSGTTDYFYKIGDVSAIGPREHAGLLDFYNSTRHFGDLATYFVDKMPLAPNPSDFLGTNEILLNVDLTYGYHLGTRTFDPASGAVYVPGQAGVWVNE